MSTEDDLTPAAEPVTLHCALVIVVGAALAALWGINDDVLVNALLSLAGFTIALVSAAITRAKVTPLAAPRDEEGQKLIPAVVPSPEE